MKNKSLAILVSWNLSKVGASYYISDTHFLYLNFAVKYYKHIYLLSTVKHTDEVANLRKVDFPNLEIVDLPYSGSYVKSLLNVFSYFKRIKRVASDSDLFYCRVPDPFSWMPKLLFGAKCILHFVGDTIDATEYNEKWSWIRKKIMIAGYYPDYMLTLLAARKSSVFTNGYHLANKLKKFKIDASAVISSTISEKVFAGIQEKKDFSSKTIDIIYVGYIRYAKGINCLMNLCKCMYDDGFDFRFHIVGEGEMYDELREFITKYGMNEKVILHGHIDDKPTLLHIIKKSDLFFFPSLSEGSPRVVIESMSQGVPVVSTPVGSLPTTFEDKKEILFFDFDNYEMAYELIKSYHSQGELFDAMRKKAYEKVKSNYTLESFLSKIFLINEK